MSESEILAALSVDNVRAHVEYITENPPTPWPTPPLSSSRPWLIGD
jgi:hypothetical protein